VQLNERLQMTTQYDSREQAIELGLYYAGFVGEGERQRVMESLPEPKQMQLGWPQEKTLEVYSFDNPQGEAVQIGVGEFRGGFDLWLINPITGGARRL